MIDHIEIKLKPSEICKNGDVKYNVEYYNIEANPISKDKFY